MMDCGSDEGGLEDFLDLAGNISHSTPTIRDAAERLLSLLGVDDSDDDFLSSSEDEGVELDPDDEDDVETPENTRLLHQLASSLAQELKYVQKHSPTLKRHRSLQDDPIQCIELAQGILCPQEIRGSNSNQLSTHGTKFSTSYHVQELKYSTTDSQSNFSLLQSPTRDFFVANKRYRVEDRLENPGKITIDSDDSSFSWSAGWDACATEAVRYLLEDEGLAPHHPTVLALKNHLEMQRTRALANYST